MPEVAPEVGEEGQQFGCVVGQPGRVFATGCGAFTLAGGVPAEARRPIGVFGDSGIAADAFPSMHRRMPVRPAQR